jgi:DNA topoisomerase I
VSRLRRADCSEPGITRVRRGRGFSYHEEDGTAIRDAGLLERIRELAIPPAWGEVWICPDHNGHIQATGIDAAGRKQYLYHRRWRERRDAQKFDEMLDFASALPSLRRRVRKDMRQRGLVRGRVLACALRLLDLGFFRVGSEEYAEENQTYGLATLRRSHIRFAGGGAIFDYRAKGGQRVVQELEDEQVVAVLQALAKRNGGGRELLAFYERRQWRDVRAADVNAYLKEAGGGDFSAKDFRTWNATVLAAVALASRTGEEQEPPSRSRRRRIANAVVKDVARYLSNTPAVCRSSYIDPRLFDRFDSNLKILAPVERAIDGKGPHEFADREEIEAAVLDLLG